MYCEESVIPFLLSQGVDANARNAEDETPWMLAQKNDNIKGKIGYWALNDARFK